MVTARAEGAASMALPTQARALQGFGGANCQALVDSAPDMARDW